MFLGNPVNTENNILKELDELKQFSAEVEKLRQQCEKLRSNISYIKYYKLYGECNFALSALLWKIEDDMNFLGSLQKEATERNRHISIEGETANQIYAMIKKIDGVIQDAELDNIHANDVIGWCINYNREDDGFNIKLQYETT